MKSALLLALVAATAASAGASIAAPARLDTADRASAKAPKKQKVMLGFHANRTIRYFDFGAIKLKQGNEISKMWVFTNGAAGQRAVVDSVPGRRKGYSPLRRVYRVTWRDGAAARVLESSAAVAQADEAGDLTVRRTDTVANAPVLGFGQVRHAGFARNKVIHYYELGLIAIAPGNEVLPIWTFTNGVEGQRNIADVVPGTTAYTPLWAVVKATWQGDAKRRLLRSHGALMQAVRAGEITLEKTPMIVNCPFL
jgi:hypothetical protein